MNGDILINAEASRYITVNDGSTLNGNIILNTGGTLDVKFTDAIWNGSFKDIGGNAASVINFTFTRSKINPTAKEPTDMSFSHGTARVSVDNSDLNLSVYSQATNTSVTLTNKSSIKQLWVMGGEFGISATDSYIDYISVNAGHSNISLTNSTLGKDGGAEHNGYAIFLSGAAFDLTAKNSTINGSLYTDAYNHMAFEITGSTLNGSKKNGYAIENYYGYVEGLNNSKGNSFFDSSTINGGIVWINSNFGQGEGLAFRNGTILNGNLEHLDRPYGNSTIGASFNFNASTMNGDIIDGTSAITTTNGTANHALTNVTFRNKSTLN
ncbi:hypothetical protein, partial [Helicobacter sp. 13S00482-2]|uniref:hypothetical protein n=1 Tax=Helicobacter sp. 13S00482-2 TaxID=1476200 RepID=UPI00117BCFCD